MMKDFSLELKTTVAEVDAIVLAQLPKVEGQQKTVLDAMQYSVAAGGKRIRPILVQKCYALYKDRKGASWDRFMKPIVEAFMGAIEMIHTFSLCHDDLPCMDGDKYRRGQESTWYKFGEDMGTLAGDALSLYAFQRVTEVYLRQLSRAAVTGGVDSPDESSKFANAVLKATAILAGKSGVDGMLGGQTVDVEMTGKPLSEPQLQFIYELKTGALLEASMMMGAVLGNASQMELQRLGSIARSIGVAFQIEDDILDETSTQEVLGKPIHSDEENNKTTWVSIHGLEAAQAEVQRLSEEAIEGLKALPEVNEDARQFLIALTEELIHRKK